MKNKLAVISTTVMLGIGSFMAVPNVKAQSNNPLQSIQGQRTTIQASISQADSTISQVQFQLAQLNEQVSRLDQAIQKNSDMMVSTEGKITDTNAEVAQLQSQITILKDRIAKRNEVLKKRALSFQESGGELSYLDVLLGASSFSDLIDRVSAVTTIVEADQDLIRQHEADKQQVEAKQTEVEKRLADLQSMKADLVAMQAQINSQKVQNDTLKQQLQQKQQNSLAQKANLQKQDTILASQQSVMEQALIQQSVAQPSTSIPAQNTNSSVVSSVGTSASSSSAASSNTSSYTTSRPAASSSSKGSVNTVLTAGYRYFGKSVYVFGGGRSASDIANGFFDCSGFVHWAFAQAGISVPASTDALTGAGRQVPASQMQPGDLVFFDTYKKDGHVGIYMGGGKFIGSQDSTGVAIANMASGYWAQHFNGRVVRVF
ncbi:PcsB-like coiled-coil domain-containing protein [Neobacillus sp. SM06]|uniref:C40 family peptidase n=1 Tax=Neobacillus sp. SM06 TaxID=3422492 RepID=UPI003D289157